MAKVTYKDAGVDLDVYDEAMGRLPRLMHRTFSPRVLKLDGGFAGLFQLDFASRLFERKYEDPILVSCTDGVGTKLILSRRAGRLFDAGADLAAHCLNDVATTGAEPLFFLDYAASASLDLEEVAELVEGAASVCRAAGCAIIGGETAELPGVYRDEELDFAGTCVGLVRRAELIDGSRCRPGDVVLGLPSSGLHANGFTLVRSLIGDGDFDADLLLPPTRLYLEEVRRLRASCDVRALAHVTGGGIMGNLPRVLPEGVGVELDWGSWERPPVYAWLDEQGVSEDEQRRVFNLGIGMCAVVPAEDAGSGTVIGRLA